MLQFIKNLFHPSRLNHAYKACAEVDQDLVLRIMMFHEAHKLAGVNLPLDEKAFPQLDEIIDASKGLGSEEHELTLDGVSAFLGCIVRDRLSGKWNRSREGKYLITDVGGKKLDLDLSSDIRELLAVDKRPSVAELYSRIQRQSDDGFQNTHPTGLIKA